jgi:hypothetical protein
MLHSCLLGHMMNSVTLLLWRLFLTCRHVLTWLLRFVWLHSLSFSSFGIFTAGSPHTCIHFAFWWLSSSLGFLDSPALWMFDCVQYTEIYSVYQFKYLFFYIPYKEAHLVVFLNIVLSPQLHLNIFFKSKMAYWYW